VTKRLQKQETLYICWCKQGEEESKESGKDHDTTGRIILHNGMHHPTLVDCPDSCKHDTDNGNKIGDENDICPTEPSWKKHDKYDQRDINGKSNKVIK
jgi:hypothetical protein